MTRTCGNLASLQVFGKGEEEEGGVEGWVVSMDFMVYVENNRNEETLQKLKKDVVKGVIAYVKGGEGGGKFYGPSPVDYTTLESEKNIYDSGFPDSSVYVYPKVTRAFAFNKKDYTNELHLGVAKQFFEAFTVRGDTVGSFYCGGGTGAAAAMLLGLNSVSVDVEGAKVHFFNSMRVNT
jgi:hypothetical protein